MILGLNYGDPERIIIIIFILSSLYGLWKGCAYDNRLKVLLTIPRVYLLVYYLLIIFKWYLSTPLENAVKAGIGSLYGVLMLFGVEAYARWATRKYGQK